MSIGRSLAIRLFGWRLFAALTALALSVTTAIALQHPDVEGIREIVILSVRYSLLLFCLAFSATALHELWPTSQSRWLLNNRRYIGLSFAAVHSIHIVALIIYAVVAPDVYANNSRLISEVFGVIGYAFVLAMTVTSFSRTKKWLTPARWTALHTTGGYCIWAVFMYMFVKRVIAHPLDPIFSIALTMLLSSVALRLQARRLGWRRFAAS